MELMNGMIKEINSGGILSKKYLEMKKYESLNALSLMSVRAEHPSIE